MAKNSTAWLKKPLGDVASVISGYAFKSSEFREQGIPVIKIKNIRVGFVDLSDADHVDEKYCGIHDRYHVQRGDVLISLTGSHITQPNSVVGRVARHAAGLPRCLLNQRAGKVIIKDRSRCDPNFLFYALSEQETLNAIAMKAHGAASQANVSPSQVESIEIPLPPLPIQQRIAGILSAYDELIENSQRRIKTLESMARALYREWFVHFRFPGHESVPRVQSPLGGIPQGWEVTTLGCLVEIRKGKNITKGTIRDGNVPVVAGGIAPAYFHDVANTQSPVITISASGANAGFVNLYYSDVWASDCSFIDKSTTPHVLYYYLWLDHRRAAVTHLQRGSAQPHVYPKDLAQLEAVRVPKDVLDAFTSQIAPIFGLTMRLAAKIENLRRTRDLLLPRLLSGQLNVKAA